MKIMSAAIALSLAASAGANVVTRDVDYEQGGVKLRGFLAYDDAKTSAGKLPGVLVVHEWWGLNDYVKHRAVQLAQLGYVAFALDMYGAGVLASDPGEAGKLAGQFYGKPLMAERAQAGLDQLLASGLADPSRIAAIGYCFGGSTVQALAYSGAPLAGVVSFHGGLIPVTAEAAARTKAKMLICHGALDPGTKPEQLAAFLKAANDNRLDYQFDIYAGAYHAFTNPASDATAAKFPGMKGFIAYSPSADARSWRDMQDFFGEIFSGKGG
ncbi:MAG TPA: dienelactone hydrolase family protein [Opitutaceae bacterium]|jgi:dienelactone hydrolase